MKRHIRDLLDMGYDTFSIGGRKIPISAMLDTCIRRSKCVCGKDGTKKCSKCNSKFYCSKDCWMSDKEKHGPECETHVRSKKESVFPCIMCEHMILYNDHLDIE